MSSLPPSVTKLLKSKKLVHLATCNDSKPHVSLMNYSFIVKEDAAYIVLLTPTCTTKYKNMVANPNVSLLVHDWVSSSSAPGEEQGKRRNSLFELLANINKAEISSVSVMLDGEAHELKKGSEEYDFYKSVHLNSGFINETQAENYIAKDDNALILVTIRSCQVTDADNNVQTY